MKPEQLLTIIESHYGHYENEAMGKSVFRYLESLDERELPGISKAIVIKYSSQYKTPPDVAIIHDILSDIKADRMWLLLQNKSSGDSVLIVDINCQETIRTLGGWDTFCERRDDEPKWCQKEFVNTYKRLFGTVKDNPRMVLLGFNDKHYNHEIKYDKVKVICESQEEHDRGIAMIEKIKTEDERAYIENAGYKKIDFNALVPGQKV